MKDIEIKLPCEAVKGDYYALYRSPGFRAFNRENASHYDVGRVERTTKTQIIANGVKFWKQDGRPVGGGRGVLMIVSEEFANEQISLDKQAESYVADQHNRRRLQEIAENRLVDPRIITAMINLYEQMLL